MERSLVAARSALPLALKSIEERASTPCSTMTAKETLNENHAESPRWRFRYSLASMVLVTTVVALTVALVVTNRQWKADVAELKSLRDMAGQLTVSDPERVHAIGVPTVGSLKWQWHVYIPEDRKYQFHLVTGKVPRTGIPAKLGTPQVRSGFPRSGEFLLTAAVEKNNGGKWVLAGSVPGRDFSHPIENQQWIGSKGHGISAVEPGKTVSAESGSPLVLLQVRVDGTESSDGKSDGLMIYIDEFNY